MSDQQLWSDSKIYETLYNASDRHPGDYAPILYGSAAESICHQIRNDYERRITELEAQLAQLRSGRWMPVADGAYHYQGNDVVVQGNLLGVAQHGKPVYAGALPDMKRLCEWVEGEDMPADVRQNILDMCDDWKQSGYEDDELGFDYERAHVVMDWLQRRGGAA